MSGPSWRTWSGRRATLVCSLVLALAGCAPWGDESRWLVVATPWPAEARAACEAIVAADTAPGAIRWVELGAHRWLDACDRRGGIDLILGGSTRQLLPLSDAGRLDLLGPTDPVAWRLVDRPQTGGSSGPSTSAGQLDPREDPDALAEAQAILAAQGWAKGYSTLMHRPVALPFGPRPTRPAALPRREVVGLVRVGKHRDQALAFLAALTRPLAIAPAPPEAELDARGNDLLADLLGAALIDAQNERRDALIALEQNHHPDHAEAALGEPPPWPPASVAKLRADPARQALADDLAAQLAPDGPTLDWLEYHWRRPKQAIDLDVLRRICQAEDGRLVRSPRFRAWLGGEWTAWTQQLDRRVARLAGGYQAR